MAETGRGAKPLIERLMNPELIKQRRHLPTMGNEQARAGLQPGTNGGWEPVGREPPLYTMQADDLHLQAAGGKERERKEAGRVLTFVLM